MPKYETTPALPERSAAEHDYFSSLAYLRQHYGLKLANRQRLPYPYNVLVSAQELRAALAVADRARELFIVRQESGSVCLSVRERIRREYFAYYIPVVPLYRLWQQPGESATAELLTAVFAYLHREAGIGYYREADTYMAYNYEILSEWVDEGEEEEPGAYTQQREDQRLAELAGDFVQARIMEPGLIPRLPDLIAAFEPETPEQLAALEVAKTMLALSRQYPGASLFAHASEVSDEDGEYSYSSAICMHEYIGFVASTSGALGEMLIEMVENDFNERSGEQEPELLTHFHIPQEPYRDELAYEYAVFSLINDLCTLL
ncbi:hypothetical protein [Mucilaginibacter lacusdianchii]|uniref:hypothetical protein n=1 Tax=Mucilaginibacter lacusdianchii TaxID=2684211 RepID=UPI00131A681C|nr:hypothetical protein [Mucilaginibacter sp. JXJ CY 39]